MGHRSRLALLLTVLCLLPGCTAGRRPAPADAAMTVALSTDSRPPARPVAGARPGGTVTVLLNNAFEHLDPARTYIARAQLTNVLLQRTLTGYRRTPDGRTELVGDLATDTGRASEGDRVWTYTLRPGLRFEDGSAITARDVAYGIARSFSPSLPDGPTLLQQWLADSPDITRAYRGPYDGGAAVPPGVSTPDPRTVVLRFARPHQDVPFVVALGTTTPVPRGRDTRTGYDTRPVATGPYRIVRYERTSTLVLERNPHWAADTDPIRTAYPDRFVFEFGQPPATATTRILAGHDADRAAVSLEQVPSQMLLTVAGDSSLATHATVGRTPYVAYLAINTQRVRDVRVRRALNCAFDRDGYIRTIGGLGVAEPATTVLGKIIPGYRSYAAYDCGRAGDPERARRLLGTGTVHLRYGHRDNGTGRAVAAFLKAGLARAGMELTTVPIDPGRYFSTIHTRDNGLDIYMTSWGPDWPTAQAVIPPLMDGRLITARGNSSSSYLQEPRVNAEIDRIGALTDRQAAARAWGALDESIMRDYAPLVPVYHDRTLTLNGDRVGGLHLHDILGFTSLENAFVRP